MAGDGQELLQAAGACLLAVERHHQGATRVLAELRSTLCDPALDPADALRQGAGLVRASHVQWRRHVDGEIAAYRRLRDRIDRHVADRRGQLAAGERQALCRASQALGALVRQQSRTLKAYDSLIEAIASDPTQQAARSRGRPPRQGAA